MTVVILGCGYTGQRIARRMLDRGARVICTSRNAGNLTTLAPAEAIELSLPFSDRLDFIPEGAHVVFSIPPVDNDSDPGQIWRMLASRAPRRLIYLSTTGVYGDQKDVDQHTEPAPRHERDMARLAAERSAQEGPWSALVLRPAAIYGRGRGIQQSMAEGRFRLVGSGENFVSRIHVDDLAAHVEAGLMSDVQGAWPVADDQPCPSREIAGYCSDLLALPFPDSIPADAAHHTRRADRRVDGRGIRDALSIRLIYANYTSGIPASL